MLIPCNSVAHNAVGSVKRLLHVSFNLSLNRFFDRNVQCFGLAALGGNRHLHNPRRALRQLSGESGDDDLHGFCLGEKFNGDVLPSLRKQVGSPVQDFCSL